MILLTLVIMVLLLHRVPDVVESVISKLVIPETDCTLVVVSSASDGPALTTAGFQVPLALASGQSHGYAVMGFVDQLTDGRARLGPGTLYRTLARLVADELVRESGASDPTAPHDARRRYYELTPLGAKVVREEAELLARLVDAAHSAGLLNGNRRNR
jgi:DNA-binding PadR family transcriptional regulator